MQGKNRTKTDARAEVRAAKPPVTLAIRTEQLISDGQGGWRIENVAVGECLKHDFWREVTGSPGGKLKPRQRVTVENAKEIVTLYVVSVDDIKRRAQVVVEFTLELPRPDYSTTDIATNGGAGMTVAAG